MPSDPIKPPVDLICYLHPAWAPRIRPALAKRDWMETTPERFAYRCLPLAIANAHGWEIGSPCGFEARWNGGRGTEAVEIRLDPGTAPAQAPVSLFGQGTITFHVEGLFRTSPGWNLWVGGAPNAAKDGIAPLGGVIETDWSPYSFTMNWRFTRRGEWVRWEKDEPFCFFFPIERGVLDGVAPELRPLADAPELEEAFTRWSASRDAFQAHVRKTNPKAPADRWQKLYYRGVGPDGEPGPDDHQAKLRLEPFREASGPPAACPAHAAPRPQPAPKPAIAATGAKIPPMLAAMPAGQGANAAARIQAATNLMTLNRLGFDAAPRPGAAPIAPALAASPAPAAADKPDRLAARRGWIDDVARRQRALAADRPGTVPRVRAPSADEFLDLFYAASRPVVIEGAMAGWPALDRWTADYLAAKVGAAPIVYQGGRDADPDFELYKDRHTRRMAFDRFVAAAAQGAGNDAYVTAYNSAENRTALAPLNADLGALDAYLKPSDLIGGDGMMWIGPAGTFTPLHFDLTNNLLAQIVGRKRLVLLPPSETAKLANSRHVFSDVHDVTDPAKLERFPEAKDARRFEVEIGPGDLLYIPVGWWHQVRSCDFSVMLTYTNFRWANNAYASFPGD
jgi:hypothetical protein